jgi:hypothetical protein
MANKKKVGLIQVNPIFFLPLILMVAVVPLIVFMKIKELSGFPSVYWVDPKQNVDFFSYYKSVWILISAVLALISWIVINRVYHLKEKKHAFYIPLGIYTLFLCLSTVFALHKETAVFGFPDRYEGLLVLFSYVVAMVVAFHMVNSKRDAYIVLGFLFVSAGIAAGIGLFQFFGMDFFRSQVGKLLILPQKYHGMAESLNFRFGPKTIYTTMYNTNNVGSYMALLFPLAVTLSFFTKNKFLKGVWFFLSLLLFFNVVGSNSRAGYMGALLSFVLILIFLRNWIRKNLWETGVMVGSLILIFAGINAYANQGILSRVKYTAEEMGAVLGLVEKKPVERPQTKAKETETKRPMEYTVLPEQTIVREGDRVLKLVAKGSQVVFMDETDAPIPFEVVEEGKAYQFQGPYRAFSMKVHIDKVELYTNESEFFYKTIADSIVVLDQDANLLKAPQTAPIEKITFEDAALLISAGGSTLKFFRQDNQFLLQDKEDKTIGLSKVGNDGRYMVMDSRFIDYTFRFNKYVLRFYKDGELVAPFLMRPRFIKIPENLLSEERQMSMDQANPSIPKGQDAEGMKTILYYPIEPFLEVPSFGFSGKRRFRFFSGVYMVTFLANDFKYFDHW